MRLWAFYDGGATYHMAGPDDIDATWDCCRRYIREVCQLDEEYSPESDWELELVPDEQQLTFLDDDAEGGERTLTAAEWVQLEAATAERDGYAVVACSE